MQIQNSAALVGGLVSRFAFDMKFNVGDVRGPVSYYLTYEAF